MAVRCPRPPFFTSQTCRWASFWTLIISTFCFLILLDTWGILGGSNKSPTPIHEPPLPDDPAQTRSSLTNTNTTSSTEVERGRCPCAEDPEQKLRKQRIVDVCSGNDSVKFLRRPKTFQEIPLDKLGNLIADDEHQIIYCYVPKVGSTHWKKVLAVLTGSVVSPSTGKPYTDPAAVPDKLIHKRNTFLTLAQIKNRYGSLSDHMMALKLQHYTKFLFVRDPFVRLISAFRHKFERCTENDYDRLVKPVLNRYANFSGDLPKTLSEAQEKGLTATFEQFIRFLVDPEKEPTATNEHWLQVYHLCNPCHIKYDFIGHLETMESEADTLLKLLKVDHLVRFPPGYENPSNQSLERAYFSKIPPEMMTALYKEYEVDFKLFGYPKPDFVH